MTTHGSSSPEREATPHATNSTTNNIISDAVRRRAHALINDHAIDAGERIFIRYVLETNDAGGLTELVQWLEGQVAVDRVDKASEELSARGLTV